MTVVVNFKDVKEHWNAETRQWDDPQYVYIGRRNRFYGLPQSKWANPYRLAVALSQEEARAAAIGRYAKHLVETGLVHDVDTLRGKTLVCWCSPLACHGDVLVKMLNEEEEGEGE